MKAAVYNNNILAGYLVKDERGYSFKYINEYLMDAKSPAISLTLPKQEEEFRSEYLFSFFYGLLAEGDNKELQCRSLLIDEHDHFTRLIKTAGVNTIGGVTVRPAE